MRNKTVVIVPFTLIFLVISLFAVPLSSAEVTITYSYPYYDAAAGSTLTANHPSSTVYDSSKSQTFPAATTGYLKTITIGLMAGKNAGGLQSDALIHMDFIDVSNTLNHNGDGDIIETSSTVVDASNLAYYIIGGSYNNTYAGWVFEFNGTTPITAGNNYGIRIYADSATRLNEANYPVAIAVTAPGIHSGYMSAYKSSAWGSAVQSAELALTVIVDSDLPATPAPTAAPTATPNAGLDDEYYWNGTTWVPVDNVVETYTDMILPILVPLIIILLCAGLGAYFIGVWGFILGLDVAVILLYVALPTYMPLWGVILVAIGNVLVLMMGRNRNE